MPYPCTYTLTDETQTEESETDETEAFSSFYSEIDQTETLLSFYQKCDGDDEYACLRSFRENPALKSLIDVKAFAQRFKKYEQDRDNFSLYIWGYVMPNLE